MPSDAGDLGQADLLPRIADGVVLRRLSPTDLAAFQAYRHDPVVGEYQGWSPLSDEEASAFLADMSAQRLLQAGTWSQIGIAQPDSPVLIGDIGLFLSADGQQAEVGFTLRRESRRRGIATTAVQDAIELLFEETKIQRVIGITDARNQSSVRLLERVGMRKVETRGATFRDQPCIEYVYAVSRLA